MMAARTPADQIAFRYRSADSTTGVTRETAKRLAERHPCAGSAAIDDRRQ
jgi:hypothetical protein